MDITMTWAKENFQLICLAVGVLGVIIAFISFICESGEDPLCAPGEQFCYSDIGYTLLANGVEKVSGIRFEDYLKKNIFEPAGMKDTGIYHTRRDGIPSDRFVRNMVLEDGGYVPSDKSENSAGYVVGSDGLNGCDYAYTTVFDMLAWDRALRNGTVLTFPPQAFGTTRFRATTLPPSPMTSTIFGRCASAERTETKSRAVMSYARPRSKTISDAPERLPCTGATRLSPVS